MLSFLDLCGLAFVASTLLATSGAHLAGLPGFARLLREHGLLPGTIALPLAVLVAGVELASGLAALAALAGGEPRLGTAAFAAALGAGAVFFAYLRRLLRAGHTGSCGCSPLASPLTPVSFVPAASLGVVGAIGLLARWVVASDALTPWAWGCLAVAWGVTLAALVLLLPASAPGKTVEAAP